MSYGGLRGFVNDLTKGSQDLERTDAPRPACLCSPFPVVFSGPFAMDDTATPKDLTPAGTAVTSLAAATISADPENVQLCGPHSNNGSRGDSQMGT